MSAVNSLTRKYGSFFSGCIDVALLPYTLTMKAFIANPKHVQPHETAIGLAACIFFSTVIPILSPIASFTFFLAGFAACLALASMFVTYPLALVADALDESPSRSFAF